ncbi:restriction endonuclease subunit S [Chlorobium sp. KB01]|uniref:restriction endonuclease subunit S n=1 Tax=Chlorobium sp. KB01 TaxID=1917528 RepID=UPI0018E9C1C6|nr:restriction endonuclease subunit S [Chlorobium sp. KB01]
MKAGWEIKKLGDVCDVMNGGTPKTGDPANWDGNHLWITPAEMGKRLSPYVSDTERKLSDIGLRDSSAKLLPPNSVILSSRAPIGHLVVNTELMATNQGCKGLIPRSQLYYKYLYYYLLSVVELLNSLGSGATFKELSGGKLKDVEIPIPSSTEQQRIVAILDEAFEGIATAKANAEQNLKNARALFDSYLNSVFTQRGDGWVEKRLEDVCALQRGFDLPTRSRVPGSFPLVSSSGFIDTHVEGPVKGPGVATGRSGSIGRVFYIENDYWPLNTVLFIKEFHGNDSKLVYWLLTHFDLNRFATGTGVPTLNRNFVHDERVFFPDEQSVQKIIATKIDVLWEETQQLESIYQKKISALDALKKSILNKAFSGEL